MVSIPERFVRREQLSLLPHVVIAARLPKVLALELAKSNELSERGGTNKGRIGKLRDTSSTHQVVVPVGTGASPPTRKPARKNEKEVTA